MQLTRSGKGIWGSAESTGRVAIMSPQFFQSPDQMSISTAKARGNQSLMVVSLSLSPSLTTEIKESSDQYRNREMFVDLKGA